LAIIFSRGIVKEAKPLEQRVDVAESVLGFSHATFFRSARAFFETQKFVMITPFAPAPGLSRGAGNVLHGFGRVQRFFTVWSGSKTVPLPDDVVCRNGAICGRSGNVSVAGGDHVWSLPPLWMPLV